MFACLINDSILIFIICYRGGRSKVQGFVDENHNCNQDIGFHGGNGNINNYIELSDGNDEEVNDFDNDYDNEYDDDVIHIRSSGSEYFGKEAKRPLYRSDEEILD